MIGKDFTDKISSNEIFNSGVGYSLDTEHDEEKDRCKKIKVLGAERGNKLWPRDAAAQLS